MAGVDATTSGLLPRLAQEVRVNVELHPPLRANLE
jgi:hypothetical protein